MTTIGEALIEVRADMSRLSGDVERGTSSSKMSRLGSVAGKGLAVGFTAAAGAVLAGGAFLKGAFDEAQEAVKVGAQTAAVIKATGGAAGVSVKHVESLAGAISKKVGIDDEAIQSGANLLLTFKNVRNEVGKGNAIFDRANRAAVDLSAAGFGSIEGASKMLGKALNDPVKGMSAMSRAGVTFTQQQQDQVKALVESGRALDAQKIIMREVESQVGGSAAAQATAADKMGVAWGNLKEQVGTALMPMFTSIFEGVTNRVIPALSRGAEAIGPFVAQIGPAVQWVRNLFESFRGSDEATGRLSELRATFASVFESIKGIVAPAVQIIRALWSAFGDDLMRYTRTAFSALLQIIRGAFKVVQGIFNVVAGLLRGDWSQLWQGIKQIVSGAWSVIKGIVKSGGAALRLILGALVSVLKGIMSRAWDAVKSATSSAWAGIKSLVRSGAEGVVDFVRGIPDRIIALAGAYLNAGKTVGGKIIGGIMDGLRSAGGFVSDLASSVKSAINGALNLPFTIKGPGPLPDFTIPAFARGTKSAPGGMALVGERGPELVNLPRGSEVVTAARTRALAARGALGGYAAGSGAGSGPLRLVSGSLTIDENGVAYFRGIAEEVASEVADFGASLERMNA